MYSFDDRNGDNLSLRPEGTAGCVRAADQHGLLYNQQQRLWYQGPMFRHERPQKGRFRQFEQFGIESFGSPFPEQDAEIISMAYLFYKSLNIKNLNLRINTFKKFIDTQLKICSNTLGTYWYNTKREI